MTKTFYLIVIVLLFVANQTFAQSGDGLRAKIERIVASKKAVVGVSIVGNNGKDTISINGEKHFPMQSVFKFHIGLAMLSEIDRGKFSLEQKVEISKKDLLLDLYSPIKDEYPNGTTLTIAEILEYTVSKSDNVGCEVLLRMLGGPQAVENYFVKNRFRDIAIKFNEEQQQANWDLQFQNWTTPNAANKVLEAYYANSKKLLSPKSHDFMWKVMRETETGQNRLKGQLPAGTGVAHKTGSSGVNKATGITAAVNDIGIVFLPNGKHFLISVFVTDSKEDAATNEKMIADIAKVSWDHFAKEASGQKIAYDTIRYAEEYHRERLTLFAAEPIVKGKVVFLGDSITEFGDWQKLLGDPTIINRGIAGDNTFGVLARLDDVLKREPSKLFVKVGINDISQNISTGIIARNIASIVKNVKTRSPKTKIYLHSVLPTNDNVKNEYPAAYNKNDIVDALNIEINKLSKKHNLVYIDLNSVLRDRTGKLDVKYAAPDGLHLNELGYKAWVELLEKQK